MRNILIYPAGTTEACGYAANALRGLGFSLTDHPTPEITHLLLDVPSFRADRKLRDGTALEPLLAMLPEHLTVVGGNLNHPALAFYQTLDLLQDPDYVARNAAITAECALRVAAPRLKTTFSESPALILGWGRIGKCLGQLLSGMGCSVTIAARKDTNRAMLRALGYETITFEDIPKNLPRFRLLFNTVPTFVLGEDALDHCKDCIQLELASVDGIIGKHVITARGLPGVYAPASSGRLIANTFYRLWKENET